HVGASPRTVALTRRVSFAKRLIDDTRLRITQIALAAGFRSVRRFNSAFRRIYGRAPGELRRQRGGGPAGAGLPPPPLPPPASGPPAEGGARRGGPPGKALRALGGVAPGGSARPVATGRGPAVVRVRPLEGEHALELRVGGASPGELFGLSVATRRMFDLAAD